MKRIISAIFALCICAITSASAAQPDGIIRVGLYVGSNTLEAPQLQNEQGSGYMAGYYDSDLVFHSLYYITDTKLVMLRDTNYVQQSDGTYSQVTISEQSALFSSTADADSLGIISVGAYHIQLDGTYSTAAQAAIVAEQKGGFVAYANDTFYVRVGDYVTTEQAETFKSSQNLSGTIVGDVDDVITVIETTSGEILFEYDGAERFAIAPQGDNPVTWFKGYKYYGDFVYIPYGDELQVQNYVYIEDYLKGVLPYEMSDSWSIEALKAQAVCARSNAISETKHLSDGYDVCNTTNCQVYKGLNSAGTNTDLAVEQTEGIYATVNGNAVGLYYFSSSGGATEDAVNVWGGDYSYLIGKIDTYELMAEPESNAVWSVEFTASELESKIRAVNSSFGTLKSIVITERTAVDNVLEVTATDTSGKEVVITKSSTRSVFGLNSQRYTITGNGGQSSTTTAVPTSITEGILQGFNGAFSGTLGSSTTEVTDATSYIFSGTGWGHHVGMSQYGALEMAKQGKTFDEILNFYFTGITLTTKN